MFAYRRQGPGRRQEAGGDGRVFGQSGLLESKKCPLQNRERVRATGVQQAAWWCRDEDERTNQDLSKT